MRGSLLAMTCMCACTIVENAENFGKGPSAACETASEHCGRVYACEAASTEVGNPTGHIETCVPADEPLSDVEEIYGDCRPTPRHEGTCVWGCGDDPWAHFCNSYDGCFGCKRGER